MNSILNALSLFMGQVNSQTTEATGQSAPANDPSSLIMLFVILFGIMYVFLILPQRRREKKHRMMISSIEKNDHVITAGGVHGIVMSVKDNVVMLKIDEDKDIKIKVNTASLSHVMTKDEKDQKDQ